MEPSMNEQLAADLETELQRLRDTGTYKVFNALASPMDAVVTMEGRGEVLVLSSNNYLGLARHPEVVAAGVEALKTLGAGTASVRFICGTFVAHLELENAIAQLVHTEAALSYVSCWNANEAVIPSLTDSQTVLLSDELNHASIIDAMRLARPARKIIYRHSNMDELRDGLRACDPTQRKIIISDGVFSMEGDLAKLPEILALARAYNAVTIVDDSHGTGVMGATGRGVAEHFGVLGEVDVITGTLGKALGGAAGGFVASSKTVCDVLAQRSRPQLFSNALPPTVARSAMKAIQVLQAQPSLVAKLRANTAYFRERLGTIGFKPLDGESAIIPIIVGQTAFALRVSRELLSLGVFVTGFGFPVVPEGTARIRVQMSAALEREHLDRAANAFERVGKELGILPA
jgi:glycine C-acetyltransferase